MVKIEFNVNEGYNLSVSGHTGAEEKGKDIVCAGVSILFYTLCASLKERESVLEKLMCNEEEGNGNIICVPKAEWKNTIECIFWTVLNGFELLANEYPDYVSFECK